MKRVKDLINELELLNPNDSVFSLYYTKEDVKQLDYYTEENTYPYDDYLAESTIDSLNNDSQIIEIVSNYVMDRLRDLTSAEVIKRSKNSEMLEGSF
jgi:hypothetical protein